MPTPEVTARSGLTVTTNPGLEDLVAAELGERLAGRGHDPAALTRLPEPLRGRLRVDHPAGPKVLEAAGETLRSAHHLLRPAARFALPAADPLAAVEAAMGQLDLPELAAGRSFRVSCERHGEHPFNSPDVERAAGAGLVARFGAPVDLTGFDVHVRVDIQDSEAAVAVQLTRQPLSRRLQRAHGQRVALKANVAYACLRLAGVSAATERLLDPFCGSGTILAEAGCLQPAAELWGMDLRERAVAGAHADLTAAGLGDRLHLRQGDATRLGELLPAGYFDAIVTNPPFGARLGRGIRFVDFYTDFLAGAAPVLRPGGRLVLLARQRGAFHRALRRAGGFRIRHQLPIETSRVFPVIFVLERRDQD
jgi:putative N6-adenine-specific DNA methylase/tRNA (guanine6-N2)-methyltransferase